MLLLRLRLLVLLLLMLLWLMLLLLLWLWLRLRVSARVWKLCLLSNDMGLGLRKLKVAMEVRGTTLGLGLRLSEKVDWWWVHGDR